MHSPLVLIHGGLCGITLLNKGIFLPWLWFCIWNKNKWFQFNSLYSLHRLSSWKTKFSSLYYTYTICPSLSSTALDIRKSYVSELYIPLCTIFYFLLSCFLGDLGPKRCKNVLMGFREGMVLILFWKAMQHSRGLITNLVAAQSASQCWKYITGRNEPTSW